MNTVAKLAVFFDLGYTLVRAPREQEFAEVGRAFGLTLDPEGLAPQFVANDHHFFRTHPGLLTQAFDQWYPAWAEAMLARLGLSVDRRVWVEQAVAVRRHRGGRLPWLAYPDVAPVVAALIAAGIRPGVISNWESAVARGALNDNGLSHQFDPVIISGEVGLEKPAPAIFRLALARAGVSPGQALHVGDNYHDDVLGARAAGICPVLLNRHGVEQPGDVVQIANLYELLALVGQERPA